MMAGSANTNISNSSLKQQIASAIHVYVQVARLSDGTRKIIEIAESRGLGRNSEADLKTRFVFERTNVSDEGEVTGRFVAVAEEHATVPRIEPVADQTSVQSERSAMEVAS